MSKKSIEFLGMSEVKPWLNFFIKNKKNFQIERKERDFLICLLTLKVKTKASTTCWDDSTALSLRVHAEPVDGKANAEIVAFLARFFCTAKKYVEIDKGEKSSQKKIRIVLWTNDLSSLEKALLEKNL